MFFNSGFDNVKKAGLLFFLLTQSMVVQAQASDAPEAAAESAVASGSSGEQQRKFSFPRWPERPQVNRERIPPAPPGPYMSSALSDFSVEGSAFVRATSKPAIKTDSFDMPPMEAFSPDIPWPGNIESPQRWEPENGYQYVKPRVKNKSYPVVQNRMPGRMRVPDMNWPSSRLPSMGNTPNGAYPHAPNYAPRYNNSLN